ncbi:uncharacterized protein BJX67DRAFT_372808 [Aspergillus lucknowensis]|uniref:Uncharacterized protein n=1 Tax=Aspergillus lucknowensis TaxID=176173 RepID=A0ABR4LNP3_9EURO
MTQPAPRRALVDLDNIEFYRPQPSKSRPPESALSIPLSLASLSILPRAAARKALPRGDGALPFDRPCGWASSYNPELLNSFDVELARCANVAPPATSSHTVSELTHEETGNEALDASAFSLTSSPSLSSPPKTTDLPSPFGSTTSRERIGIPTEPDSHIYPPSPDLQERDQPPGKGFQYAHPIYTDQVILGGGSLQLKQNISIPALSEEDPFPNDQRLPSIGVVDFGPEGQLHSDPGSSLLAESKKTSVRERSAKPHRPVAGFTPSPEPPSTTTKPPRRKSFEVAQARIVERRNRPRRNCPPRFDVVQRDRHPDCSDREESSRPTKRRKRAPRPVGKVTNPTSSGPFGKSLHSSASVQAAKSSHSQDIIGHAILTVETHALGTSYFFSFEPNSPNQLDAPQFRFSFDEPRRLTAPSPTRGYLQPNRRARMGSGANLGVTDLERKAAISGSVERM